MTSVIGKPAARKGAAEIATGKAQYTADLDFPAVNPDNPSIERMWAWNRIDRILKVADRFDTRDTVKDEVVRLGEAFSIVTEYTSFLVLENDAEYQRWKIDRRNALRIERDRRSQERVRERLATLREKSAGVGPIARSEDRPASAPAPNRADPGRQQASTPSRGWDLDLGGGGGGAFDPISAGIVAALGGLSWAALRRRKDGRP